MDDDEVVDAAHSVDGDADEAHHNGDENEHKHPLLRALQRFPGRQIVQTSQELRMLCVRVTYRDGQLIRQKVEVDKWNGCGWLMSTCGLKLFERRHEVMLLEDFPVNSPETRVIRVRAMLIQDISEM